MDPLLRDCVLEHGRAGEKTVPWDKPAFLAKNQLARPNLPADQARSFQEPMHEKFVHRIGSTRRSVRKQRNQQGDGAAEDQRRRDTERAPQVLPTSQPMPSKIARLSDANWAACPVTRKRSGCTHLMLGRHDASCDLSVIGRERIRRGLCAEHAKLWDWRH